MKNFVTILALAASVSPAAATFGHGKHGFGKKWHNADKFTCPGNSDNKCDDKFKGGFDWFDLLPGKFDFYNGFDFKGWSCEDDGGFKKIVGECGKDLETAPSFGCGPQSGVDRFSVKEFDIDVEFDARLEFHYSMPGGSTCKESHDCRRGSNKIKNRQCGGAKDVKIIFPDGGKKKEKCKIKIPKIDFDCDDNTPPPPPVDNTPPPPPTHEVPPPPPATTTSEADATTSTSESPVETTPASETTESSAPSTTPASETPVSETTPASESTPASETPVSETTTPASETPVSTPVSSAATTTSAPETTVVTTTYDSTSTIFTTEIKTITDCGPEKPSCGEEDEHTTVVVTETIPLTTTVCPVTETITGPVDTPTATVPATPETPEEDEEESPETPDEEAPEDDEEESPETPDEEVPEDDEEESPETPDEEVPEDDEDEELPCPEVVPKCLNSWLHLVQTCKDNTDAACFCPNKEFVEETFACLYAHGETDDVVAEAVSFFQGICAPYIPENPAIVTGIDTITDHLTVTGTPTVTSVPYTTIHITTVVTEPCVSDGVTIPESSTTKTISTEVTVPEVVVPTPETSVTNEVPVAPSTTAVEPPFPTGGASTTLFTTNPPVGTITGVVPTPPAPTSSIPVAGASKAKAGVLGAAVLAIVALL